MSDKRPGFFKRLFDKMTDEPRPVPSPAPPESQPDAPLEPTPIVPETVPPAPEPEPPAPSPETEPDLPPPGPPETTPEYVEEIEERASAELDSAPIIPAPATAEPRGWFQRLASGLKRSSDNLTTSITSVFTKRKLDAATLDELEDVLIQADLGIDTATAITDALRRDRFDRDVSGEDVRNVLASEVEKVLGPVARPLAVDTQHKPFVILMIGVNGSGKTTTIGKLAQKFAAEGKSVMLAAGDTFRAAAIEQLQVWGQRTGAPVVSRPAGSDASGLAFDAVTQARAEGRDVLIIDTAGRLQNRDELMNELEKVIRVIKKVEPTAPHATLLTLDATTGQNALKQVEIFGQRAGVTGLVMTKLDGTARGGILVAIAKRFGLPVHFIGVGEGVDDLEPFEARDFARAIAGQD
jgi:fused signal recognition particle receptor